MKNTFFLFVLIAVLSAFTAINYEIKKESAEVERVQGLYVFVKAKPLKEYEFLGTVTGPAVSSHEFDVLLEKFIKRVKEKYPDAEGIVFDGGIRQSHNTKVSVIKFK